MTIKTSLISVKDAVINGKKIHKGTSVKLPMFPEEEIYGSLLATKYPEPLFSTALVLLIVISTHSIAYISLHSLESWKIGK